MPVFKVCLKIFRKNWLSVSIYIVIFLAIALLISATSVSERPTTFSQKKARVAFIAEEQTPLVKGFRKELSRSTTIVALPDQSEKLQDALYFRQVTYILRIPKGFTESVLSGGKMQLEKTVVPNSIENTYVDLNVDQYWNLARLYAAHDPGISQNGLASRLRANLSGTTPVVMKTENAAKTSDSFSMFYFNFLAYTLSAVLIMGISTAMMVFRRRDLRMRHYCSPLKQANVTMQLLAANLLFAGASWAVLVGFCFLLDPQSIVTMNMLYFLINSLLFTGCIASLSYLISTVLKSLNAVSAVCNLITLGTCFISGVFVPQEFLNSTVLKIASFTPTYWYVQANTRIAKLTHFSWDHLAPSLYSMLIMLAFTGAFIAIALVIGRRQQATN
ncbi:ABC transporter permease [Sporolactobacillus inulinus]|jgi:ABC-2 type transport system permease protein|uniref:ABC-2 type transporter transmembrane domain-containing protein n=1 Tax=Sporolactobacillus inulinus CASD TaxID=1069536 RepID=A0A0U1QT07_9BACL|nr:ABC transporter permease [Sporolactobacillus inulinus]KLI03938.1 hypothetical protein SINU_00200 [Sporolactobacillus inulinus CASD]GEB76944.1 hypothetical protein SIN01_12890 [Sporolactobacillus inulinus]